MGKIKKSGQSKQCRCCLEMIGLKDLWTEHINDDEREVYGEMVNECFALLWEQPFEKTEHICDNCVIRLRDAVSFKKEILKSDRLLKEHVKNEASQNVKEEEDSDAEIETEYLSIEYLDEEEQDKTKKIIEIKLEKDNETEPDLKEELALPSKRGRRYTEEDFKKCIEAVKSRKLSQTKASIIYHVPRTTIRQALANMPLEIEHSGKISQGPRVRDEAGLKKRQDNLDNLTKYTNATPFRNVRKGYICYFCCTEYKNPANLKEHTIADHLRAEAGSHALRIKVISDKSVKLDVTDLICEICEEGLPTLESAFDHLGIEHDVDIHTDSKDHLVPFKFDGNAQKCVVCEKEFSTFKLLNDHINLKHYKNYECSICGRGFINKRSLQSHGYIHQTGESPCRYCPEVFTSRMRQIQHERYVHLGKKKRNKCLYCEEKFLDIGQKRKHENEVHGIARPTYQCNACDKNYYSQATLNRHTECYHLSLRPHKCTDCELSFFKRNMLKLHMLKHTGERKFQCDICKKSFGRKYTLHEHLRIHAEDRRFMCEHCGKGFVQKCSWRGHMRNKHKENV